MKEYATIITRKHPTLNYGQTVDIIDFNENTDEVKIKPHGDKKTYIMYFKEVWPSYMTQDCNYEQLNKDLDQLGEFDYIKK
jgi:hypothetical protein